MRLQAVFGQEPPIFSNTSIRENIAYGLRNGRVVLFREEGEVGMVEEEVDGGHVSARRYELAQMSG